MMVDLGEADVFKREHGQPVGELRLGRFAGFVGAQQFQQRFTPHGKYL